MPIEPRCKAHVFHVVSDHEFMFFMWSLIMSFGYYIVWIWYFCPCKKGSTTFPALVSSVLGVAVHIVLIVAVKYKLATHVASKRIWFLVVMGILSCGAAATLYYTYRIASLGWLGLVLGVLSSYCRRESTDFEEFSWTLFLTSMGSTVAGFLWLYHPNLCVARQYKITSYLLSGARAIQVLKWLSPKIRVGIRRMEGREEAKAEQSRLVLLRHPRRRMRTPMISLIRFGWNTPR